jgi:hypothetical protein
MNARRCCSSFFGSVSVAAASSASLFGSEVIGCGNYGSVFGEPKDENPHLSLSSEAIAGKSSIDDMGSIPQYYPAKNRRDPQP